MQSDEMVALNYKYEISPESRYGRPSNAAFDMSPSIGPQSVYSKYAFINTFRVCLVAVCLGAAGQAVAHGAIEVALALLMFFALGAAFIALTSRANLFLLRGYFVTFAVCAATAGLIQLYSFFQFGMAQSTIDAINFYRYASAQFEFMTFEELRQIINAPLPVMTWRYVFSFFEWLGIGEGAWLGVVVNTFVVALAGCLTVATGFELFGKHDPRLLRLSNLTGFCGVFLLFGAIFLRDCFSLLINVVVLWTYMRLIRTPTKKRLFMSIFIVVLCTALMVFVRKASAPLFPAYGLVALICWAWKEKPDPKRILFGVVVGVVLVALFLMSTPVLQSLGSSTSELQSAYVEGSSSRAREGSLGVAFMLNQPMPIRTGIGSVFLLAFPIPVWAGVYPGTNEYNLLKTYQAFFQLYMLPFAFTGAWIVWQRVRAGAADIGGALFLVLYALIGLLLVAATSIETRHFGQFIPAYLLLAAIPDLTNPVDKRMTNVARRFWLSFVGAIHIAWALLRFL